METGLILLIVGVVLAIGILAALTRLYKKATKTMAFVKTGLGGEKIVINGGMVVLPVLMQIQKINMETIRLTVERKRELALITKDRLRADVLVEFYLKVKEDDSSISRAAQTLGDKTLSPADLKVLVEGKFVDALRSSAAQMEMMQLHEQRAEFVQTVQLALTEDLKKNGLELESVSLTDFDQTEKKYFNPENAFDAEGLKKLTEQIQKRKEEINEVEKTTEVAIQKRDLEAKKQSLDMEREDQNAQLSQTKEIALKKAEQYKETRSYEIEKEREISEQEIEKDKTIEAQRIDAEKEIEQKRIEKVAKLRTAEEQTKIEIIAAEKDVETSRIGKETAIKTAEQEKEIQISNKERDEFLAKSEANVAKANEVKSEEAIKTASAMEIANRDKELSLIKAREIAETESIELTVSAAARKDAANDDAEALKIKSQAEADAIIIAAEAKEKDFEVEAAGINAINDANNTLSQAQIDLTVKTQLIERLPEIIAQTVKPMEKIDSIKIVDMHGGFGSSLSDGEDGSKVSLPDQVVNASLKNKIAAPMVDDLVASIGLDITNPGSILASDAFKDTRHSVNKG